MIGIESENYFACAAFVRTTVVTIIPSPLQRLHGFGYNGIVRIHLSTWLVLQLEGSVHSVPRVVTLPSLDSHGPCAGRETKDTQLYTSLIVNVILRRAAARAKCSRHHGVNLASPCIFKGFAGKKKLQGGRSSTSTSPSTLRTNCSFISAARRREQGECWLHIALGLVVVCPGKSGVPVEGCGRAPHPDQ